MTEVHLLAAVLATWRLTQIVTEDAILNPLRSLFSKRPTVRTFLGCGRCVSVWCGMLATSVFYYVPFLNWPFAFSMTFLLFAQLADALGAWSDRKTPKVILRSGMNGEINVELVNVNLPQAQRAIAEASRTVGRAA